ncbi:response regulator [Dictyobacter aurantiacus]|uniref:Response regulatory domain-containing protein n=1 Tax=Dictyobacter aurantiacus TaxID=1936993 RepID=A0A401ZP73_9CHLR|nr:response regulator [Dictyobacter aurantiacus]GCE08610.1 hypothetical protein KDAU_59390 [Dictyobacter aurantiacus]
MTARILIIEDEPDILELYRLLLEGEGYELYATDTIYKDLTEVEHIQPHLIMLDLMIGFKQEGWEFLESLQKDARTASIPLLLCTAAEHELRDKIDALKTPTIDIVFKPFDVEDLLRVVKKLLTISPIRTS